MILLSSIIATFEADYLAQYGEKSLASQLNALHALKTCRTSASPLMRAQCEDCGHAELIPHSCGHRACPHCQHHESQQWIERQLARQVPATYFLLTFTVPKALRALVWSNQQALYAQLIRTSWETVRTFARNDHQLQGEAKAIAVLHTHSRRLDRCAPWRAKQGRVVPGRRRRGRMAGVAEGSLWTARYTRSRSRGGHMQAHPTRRQAIVGVVRSRHRASEMSA
jgi:hypothetical protein